MISRIGRMQQFYRLLGLFGLIEFLFKKYFLRKGVVLTTFGVLSHPVEIRVRSSDVYVAMQIFLHREYRFDLDRKPRVLVDAGANVGLSTAYFAKLFPDTKIIALEPEAGNFRQLCENTRECPNVVAVHAALWDSEGQITVTDPGLHEWGFQTRASEQANPENAVRAMTVPTIMREFDIEDIDVLKVDIEGAEVEVFSASSDWIGQIGLLVVELHDGERKGSSRTFYNNTNNFDDEWRRGENVYLVNRRIINARPA